MSAHKIYTLIKRNKQIVNYVYVVVYDELTKWISLFFIFWEFTNDLIKPDELLLWYSHMVVCCVLLFYFCHFFQPGNSSNDIRCEKKLFVWFFCMFAKHSPYKLWNKECSHLFYQNTSRNRLHFSANISTVAHMCRQKE